jgi:prophage antirepressor-like protein
MVPTAPPTSPDPWRVFRHEWFGAVRTLWREGDLWFVAVDVAAALGYQNPSDAVWRHCAGLCETQRLFPGGRETILIPLKGVVRLVMRSRLPDAEEFQDWVCDEIIPQVMHTGTFTDTTRNQPGDAHASLESMSKGQTWMLLA